MSVGAGGAWFAAKSHGYGSGLPIAWQGWVVLLAFIVAVIASAMMLRGLRQIVAIVLCAAVLLVIAYFKTEGGWAWRWG